jgi:CO/xanthine dehydrogenase Mo-binding subunit
MLFGEQSSPTTASLRQPSVISCGERGPTAAAIANAVADAAGVRLRELPLTAQRVKAAIGI